ncbi:MAG: DNA-binding protein WhiA, partial [Clostridia bacterium]
MQSTPIYNRKQNVKQEILKSVTSLPDCCKRAFVSGCIKGSGSLELLHGKMSGIVESESAELIETIAELVSRLYGEGKDITESNRQLSVKPIYQYRVSAKALVECDFVNINAEGLYSLNDGIAKKLLRSECCKRSYLKGLFCSCGYVIMPEKLDSLDSASISAHYHLELSLNSVEACEQVYKLLLAFKIPSKVALRKSGAIVYLKGSEEIADLLVVFGAYTAKMELENVKIERQMRNDANRQTNCISANIDKA